MKKLFALIAFSASAMASAQSADPIIPEQGKDITAFIPQGWKAISSTEGDLNKDRATDIVLVIENTDSKNFIPNDDLGENLLNTNPRYFLVLFRNKNGYLLKALNKDFIPPHNSIESPCLEDPFTEAGGISITKGVITVSLKVWLSCGSYGVSSEKYKLRYENGRFVLIGYDIWESSRSTGDFTETSINFLTKQKSIATGDNLFEDKKAEAKTVWESIEINELITLANLKWPNEIDF